MSTNKSRSMSIVAVCIAKEKERREKKEKRYRGQSERLEQKHKCGEPEVILPRTQIQTPILMLKVQHLRLDRDVCSTESLSKL